MLFDVKKAATTCSPLLKLSIMDWDSLKRWSLVDLALLKPDQCLFKNPNFSRWHLSLCSMTLSNSFIIELSDQADGPIASSKGREFVSFFNTVFTLVP